ncbi:tetratricopeptide repeat protein [Agriterribacter sp.]|uniref:tetratricopeptide repeat protein n=1 Tax=Agriterribacter sp. TaxID=2821509 RepID=UPI002BC7BF98|nr:tetratricopeptide repeat protein [Agriterribacter sp.]HRP58037.1 tetratricopeptide repeat protein [Agriterribacter sp.]
MKLLSFLVLALLAAAGAARLSTDSTVQYPALNTINALKLASSISCSPDRQVMEKWTEEIDIPPMPGAGIYQWNINTPHDSARLYFNQGINTYYGFHIIESLASFKKAAAFDSLNPMIWWAQALAYGPNINDVSYSVLPQALEAVDKANALLAKAPPVERGLIKAITARYSKDTTQTREKLNADYKKAMKALYVQYPAHADVAALYVDAMMIEHPWELWNINGTPKPWTPAIRAVLEKTLIKSPEHPGLNHYYIHVMEPSPYPEKAMASADRLGRLTPGLAHMVHMPSHIYLRTGHYGKGYRVNEEAVAQFNGYLQLYPAVAGGEFLYRLHNEHMLINCAMHAGRKQYTIDKSLAFQKSVEPFLSEPGAAGNYLAYIYMVPTLMMIRFEDWNGLLQAPAVDSSKVYAALLLHFGRGMAFANTGRIHEAEAESGMVQRLVKDTVLSLPFTPFSPAIDGAVIAGNMLAGSIALAKKNYAEAISRFQTAVERENKMVYNEPRDWLLNPKYYLADAYFRAGKWKEAEAVFNNDLKDNNENIWSLNGLHKTLQQQGKNEAAAKVAARMELAARDSDVF